MSIHLYLWVYCSFLYTVKYMQMQLALPPIRFEIGSAQNTPITPIAGILARIRVSGITIITFLKMEKNTACFAFPSAMKVDCPANCNAMKINPRKYILSGITPFEITTGSLLKMLKYTCGKNSVLTQNIAVYKRASADANLIPFFTRSYCLAPRF